ncbi:MAG TPA: hypothetical protein VGM25_11075, partial [Caulobacteraceae bacterium]
NVFAVIELHRGRSSNDLEKWVRRDPEVRIGHIHDLRIEAFNPPLPLMYNIAPRRSESAK